MAAPNYEQIQSFGRVSDQLREAAVDEFVSDLDDSMSIDEVVELATRVAEKYSYLGCELGAQWYDLCSELAGLNVDPAELPEIDAESIASRVKSLADGVQDSTILSEAFNYFLQNEVTKSIRMTGSSNLWRDYERGMAGGKWARVPVGDTCGWCLMLASQGAWYLTKQSAEFKTSGDKYHDGCDCIAVYHADAESIAGYTELLRYKEMYYDAESMRMANATGERKYNEELAGRIEKAREEHQARYIAGKTDVDWTVYNETLIVMRYMYGVK